MVHASRQCPLYPQERTFFETVSMSAKCHKRTLDGDMLIVRWLPFTIRLLVDFS
jgi:hypothetical protein